MKKGTVIAIVLLSMLTVIVAFACFGFLLEDTEDKTYQINTYSVLEMKDCSFRFMDKIPEEAETFFKEQENAEENLAKNVCAEVTFKIANTGNVNVDIRPQDFYINEAVLSDGKTKYIDGEKKYPRQDSYSDSLEDVWILPADTTIDMVFYVLVPEDTTTLKGNCYLSGLPKTGDSSSVKLEVPLAP